MLCICKRCQQKVAKHNDAAPVDNSIRVVLQVVLQHSTSLFHVCQQLRILFQVRDPLNAHAFPAKLTE